jgi:hypothetical protein
MLARQVYARVGEHNSRIARMDRLVEIYRKEGDAEKLGQLEQMRQRETNSFQKDMADLEQKLGPELYGRLRAAIDSPDAGSGAQRTREAAGSESQGGEAQRRPRPDEPAPATRRGAAGQEPAGGGR